MRQIAQGLDYLRDMVRGWMNNIARRLDTWSNGKLHPDVITYIGFLMHVPVALLIAVGSFTWAATLLVIFGLFDALDGALARVQKRDSASGMLLDASTDRFKEVFLYIGAAYVLVQTGEPIGAVWAVAACGASICISYVKAKGETAVASSSSVSSAEVNSLFKDGFLRFEVRMFLLVIGLLSGQLLPMLAIITILATITAFDRLFTIQKKVR